ncbi:hypothetical protein IFM89_035783 [Coptis chinensis]|uniref:Uncharacterized protein n=1 Tax=Coptis chinensis TaxID=261450 RepID=A0A835LXE1_9MAGN|nr:hypothetical protein IFM89_035783 [Coptis chinensis]
MKSSSKPIVLTYAQKCKNILVSNWQGQLHTIKADAKGSRNKRSCIAYLAVTRRTILYQSAIASFFMVNTIIDERSSFSVTNPFPGPLASLLRSIKKLPTRVALTGDLVPLKDEKVEYLAESVRKTIFSEQKAISEASYSVSGVLTSSVNCMSRSENLQDVLDGSDPYVVYKFDIRSCTYVDGIGVDHEVERDDIVASKADLLSPCYAKLIDGFNQSQPRRRALMLFCFVYMNVNARDALMLSVDRKGFDVIGKVPSLTTKDEFGEYEWREYRFTFKEEANDMETFCRLLVEMEEEALKKVQIYSGIG